MKFAVIIGIFLSQSLSAYEGAVSRANGGVGAAVVEAGETPFQNPAGIAHLRGYRFTSGYSVFNESEAIKNSSWAFSLTENTKDTVVPTSLSYYQTKHEEIDQLQNEYLIREIRLGFANFFKRKWSFGLGVNFNENRYREKSWTQTNLVAGMLFAPSPKIGFGMFINNLVPPKSEVPEVVRQKQISSFGTTVNYLKYIRIKADIRSAENLNFGKPTIGGGIETYMNDWVIFRIGAQKNYQLNQEFYSTGLSFDGPRFGLHYGFLMSPEDTRLTSHAIDLSLPLW
jgi:hypothetical protein